MSYKEPSKVMNKPETYKKTAQTTQKALEVDRKRRDAAVNNQRTGFTAGSPDRELDVENYKNNTGRRPSK